MIAVRKNQAVGRSVYEPTREDIRRACEAIQATWTPQERAKRSRRLRRAWWVPPTILLSDLVKAINGQRADSSS